MDEKKLFLLDAYALIYRAYYALIRSPRVNSKGLNTSAVFGFVNTLEEILRKERPDYIAVCFDPRGGQTFRHELYPEYKAGRDAQPEDITLSIPYIKRLLEAYSIPAIELPRYEADDIIGTLSRMAEKKGFVTYMMTPDKDYGQLVTDRVLMYRPSLGGQGFEIRGVKEICDRYGISRPSQVIDMLALEGDASDNIPGCPGVGEKTAAKLIAQWDSVENMLEHTAEIKGALRVKIENNAEQIRFSKMLATIRTDISLDIDLESLARRPEDTDALRELYSELEFKTFISRLDSRAVGADASQSQEKEVATQSANATPSLFDFDNSEPDDACAERIVSESHEYSVVRTVDAVRRAVDKAVESGRVGVSVYAEGTEAMTAQLRGVALSVAKAEGVYIVVGNELSAEKLVGLLVPLFTNPSVTVVSHDVKRDYLLLKRYGLEMTSGYYDTSVAHYLLQPEMRHSLSAVAFSYLRYCTRDYAQTPAAAKKAVVYISDEEAMQSVCEAADVSLRLYSVLNPMLEADGLIPLFYDVELPLIRVLAEMEWTGVRIDISELRQLSVKLTARLRTMEDEAYALAGGPFNISSPMQVGEVLFDRLKIDAKAKRTKRGAYSTTEEILEKYRASVPLVDIILKIRALRKLLATYIDALPMLTNPVTGKIHTSYNQTVTATGRISSTNPNLQNIPVRTDDGREIRRAFIADDGCMILSADYSQIELRLIASISGDTDMIDAFRSGADIHQATAAKINHVPLEAVTDDERRVAKTANFGIIYGISAFGLAERLGISRTEAKRLIDGYFVTYPRIRQYMSDSIKKAREDGYVSTVMGRRRMLPDINSRNAVVRGYAERNAVNAPIQGSAADIIKVAMIAVYREFKAAGLRSRMIMQVHDELVFNVVPDELEAVREIVERCMRSAYNGAVDLTVGMGVGSNWLEAH